MIGKGWWNTRFLLSNFFHSPGNSQPAIYSSPCSMTFNMYCPNVARAIELA